MLNLSFNLVKKRGGYTATLTADENGDVLHTDILKPIITSSFLNVRKKIITLDNKRLTLTLNILSPKEPKAKKPKARRNNKLKKSGK